MVLNTVIFVELHLRAGYRMVTDEAWLNGPWPQRHRRFWGWKGPEDPNEPFFATVAKQFRAGSSSFKRRVNFIWE